MSSCQLILQDEVNCKFVGLDVKVRMEMIKELTYVDPKAKHTPQGKLGRWDGKTAFMNMGGETYINFVERVLPILSKHDVSLDIIDQRIQHNFEFEPIDKNFFSYVIFEKGHHKEGQSIILHEHQVEAVNSCLENRHGILLACTGSGKTLITAALSKKVEKYGRTIVIVPSKDLVTQTASDYKMVGLDVGVLYSDEKNYNNKHIITTWQSLSSLYKKTERGDLELSDSDIYDLLNGVVCVIVDETHSARAEALRGVLCQALRNIPIRWGLTGTLPKDPIECAQVHLNLGNVIFRIRAKELQDKGILSTCHINAIKLKSTYKYKEYQDELTYLVSDAARMKYISELIEEISNTGNTLVLVDRRIAGELICENLGLDPKTAFINGSTAKKKRSSAYEEIRWTDNQILIATFGVASTGISISRLFNVVIIEPGKSFIKTIQSIGRGLRIAEDKNHVEIWDIYGSNKFSAKHFRDRKKYYDEEEYPYDTTEIKNKEWGEQ